MSTLVIRRGTAVLGTAAALLLAVLAIAPEAGAATIYACVKSKAGTARVFTKKPKCKKGETKLSWNTTGPAGRNGINGINGVIGALGEKGAAGKEGARGLGGPAGQPQFATKFNVTVKSPKTETLFPPLDGVTVNLACAAGGASLEATGPAGTLAESGMVDSRANNMATETLQKVVYDVELAGAPVFAALKPNIGGETANVGHINATIIAPPPFTGVIIIDTFIEATPSECTVSGATFDIPI
jgi:hypothetical protein